MSFMPEDESKEMRKLPRTDASGHPLTNYTDSRMTPERQYAMRCAELDYVNGVQAVGPDGQLGLYFPSQRELVEKYDVNPRTLAQQAAQNNWHKRRKLVQHKQNVYETTLRIKDRRERSDKLQSAMVETLEVLQKLSAYNLWELQLRMEAEMKRYEEAIANGEEYLPDAGIRNADIEAMSRTVDHVGKSRDRIVREIDRQDQAQIELLVAEIEAPEPLPVVADEEKIREQAEILARQMRDEARAKGVSETEVSRIIEMMFENERLNESNAKRAQKIISGELESSPDDEDEDDAS